MKQKVNEETLNSFLEDRTKLNDLNDGITRVLFYEDTIVMEWV